MVLAPFGATRIGIGGAPVGGSERVAPTHRRRRERSEKAITQTTAETLVDRLRQRGVETIFGFAGDGIGEILEVLRRDGGGMRFISVRHEESAACAACAYGKLTGRLVVCMATSGPGGVHLINGLDDQAIGLAKALAKGPPDRFTIMRGGVAVTARELRDAPGTLV
jgi:hypothetical protein